MPESIISSLAREVNIIGPKSPIRDNDKQAESIKQQHFYHKGNKCGHDKNNPLFFGTPSLHKNRPPILIQAKKELNRLYFNPLISDAGRLSYNPSINNKDGSFRKIRSEVRNLVNNCVGECLLHYLDLKTLYVGFQGKTQFHYFGIDFIYKTIKASLINRDASETITYERVRKAVKLFEECGYLTLEKERVMLPSGRFASKPAKIRFNRCFFTDLGIVESIIDQYLNNEERKLRAEVLKQKANQYAYQQRAAKKAAKKEMRDIKELLKAAKEGHKLNKDEQEFIDTEYPGITRRREPDPPLYPEFISKLVKRPPS